KCLLLSPQSLCTYALCTYVPLGLYIYAPTLSHPLVLFFSSFLVFSSHVDPLVTALSSSMDGSASIFPFLKHSVSPVLPSPSHPAPLFVHPPSTPSSLLLPLLLLSLPARLQARSSPTTV